MSTTSVHVHVVEFGWLAGHLWFCPPSRYNLEWSGLGRPPHFVRCLFRKFCLTDHPMIQRTSNGINV
ncbi:uncharacterized protein ARMOST_15343 [Armillaria ostoyae]|uniref:Uncharacterized protein n=1 Tax=Armillaria ostoyae TaxID=47428 RepID=A0A284RT59_ARMOS|nr:uncharacterized protein ARMOST_15343 [Armillaria ostoyae]